MIARLLTEQRLSEITNAELIALAGRIPLEDRCNENGLLPTRANLLAYIRDERLNRNTGTTGPANQFAVEFVDDTDGNALFGAVLLRTKGTNVLAVAWATPINNKTQDAVRALIQLARSRGATTLSGVISREGVFSRLVQLENVVQTGYRTLRVTL